MPDHLHAIIAFSNTCKTINSIVSNGKRFMTYDIVKRLQEKNSNLILAELSNTLNNTELKEGKLHNIFKTSFDWKPAWRQTGMQNREIHSTKVRLPAYRQAGIHWNPCKGNKLVELPEQNRCRL